MMFDDASDLMNKCVNGIFINAVKIHLTHSQSNPSDISFFKKTILWKSEVRLGKTELISVTFKRLNIEDF